VNVVMLIGNLATDVELKDVPPDRKVATFLLAVDRVGGDAPADFFPVATWNRQAESCAEFLAKGAQVALDGRLRSRSWDDADGKRRSAIEVVASRVEFLGSRDRTQKPFVQATS